MNNLQLEMISNRIEKTYILFTLYKDLKSFFSENPDEIVKLSFSFDKNSPKNNNYIEFHSSLDENKTHVFSNVFHYLHKCISLFDPIKSPFGLFSNLIINNPQKIEITLDKSNFLSVFKYADDFDKKSEWIDNIEWTSGETDYVIVSHNSEWGKYPTMIFNDKSLEMWKDLKNSTRYIKSTNAYQCLIENLKFIKKHIDNLNDNQFITLQKSFLTIFEDNKIIDCFELYDFNHLKGDFDKKNNSFIDFFKNNSTMLELNYDINEKMIAEIINENKL